MPDEKYCTGRGNNGQHCCWVRGVECEFLRTGFTGRNFTCKLFVELGTWDAVHADPRYQPIREVMELGDGLCGDWQPEPGTCCRAEEK